MKLARDRCTRHITPDLLKVFEDIAVKSLAKSSSKKASDSHDTLSLNKMILQNPAAAAKVGTAMGEKPRIVSRLSQQFHHHLSAALAETMAKSVQRVRRHAQRVVLEEVRCTPMLWLQQMTNHCNTVSGCDYRPLAPLMLVYLYGTSNSLVACILHLSSTHNPDQTSGVHSTQTGGAKPNMNSLSLTLSNVSKELGVRCRFPSSKEAHRHPKAWVACDASWIALCQGTSRTFRSLHHVLLAVSSPLH
jgi:hypothetical protein